MSLVRFQNTTFTVRQVGDASCPVRVTVPAGRGMQGAWSCAMRDETTVTDAVRWIATLAQVGSGNAGVLAAVSAGGVIEHSGRLT